jgi:hypothetical protein
MSRRKAEHDPKHVRDISEAIYRARLPANDLRKLLAEPDGEMKLRERAGCYDTLTRCYLKIIAGVPAAPRKAG